MQLLSHMGVTRLDFSRPCQTVSQDSWSIFPFPPAISEEFIFSTFWPAFDVVPVLYLSHPDQYLLIIMASVCISLMANMLICYQYVLFKNASSCHFLIELFVFLPLSFECSLYSVDTSLLVCKYFLLVYSCFSIPLTGSSVKQKNLILMKYNLLIFLLYAFDIKYEPWTPRIFSNADF